eukprot:6214731-Pleurochrysis_carterae.AAC.2
MIQGLDRHAQQRLAGVRLCVLPQQLCGLGRRRLLKTPKFLGLKRTRQHCSRAERAARGRRVGVEAVELAEGRDMRGAVRTIKIAPPSCIASGGVEP